MKRTTIMLPADLKARAQKAARERGISFGELLRQSLRATLEGQAGLYDDPLFADSAVYEGDSPSDLAARHDEYLYGDDEGT